MTFSILRRLSAALLLCLTLSACGDDGIAQCEAYPACNSDQIEVDSCEEDDDTCVENTLCGSTIYCQDIPTDCAAYPSCEPGDEEVDSCPDASSCYEATECGATIFCERVEACNETPTCEEGDTLVDACPEGSQCYGVTECGSTIVCQRDAVCNDLMECDPGDIKVETCPDDASCYERDLCDTTITCQEATDACPLSFECPATHLVDPPCEQWSDCRNFYGCGESLLVCAGEERSSGCRATPTCPENYVMTEEDCTELDGPCIEETVCDTTISCVPEVVGG